MISIETGNAHAHYRVRPARNELAERVVSSDVPKPPSAAASGMQNNAVLATLIAQCDAMAEEPDRDKALDLIVRTAQQLTRATAAAVAWRQGGEMICLGRCGETAPDVGMRLSITSGLSGECVRTAKVVRCDDASTDTRVHPSFHRSAGILSILALPLIHGGQVNGVLEVFSNEANVFGETQAAALQLVAGLVVEILSGETAAHETVIPDAATTQKIAKVGAAVATAEDNRAQELRACRHCRFPNPAGAPFCGRCGVPLKSPVEAASVPEPATTGSEPSEVLKPPDAVMHKPMEPSAVSADQIANLSWERLSHEIIAGFDGVARPNHPVHSVSEPPVAVNPALPELPSPDPQSPLPKHPHASDNRVYFPGRITKWLRSVAG
jgi:GAF domain-containing protein